MGRLKVRPQGQRLSSQRRHIEEWRRLRCGDSGGRRSRRERFGDVEVDAKVWGVHQRQERAAGVPKRELGIEQIVDEPETFDLVRRTSPPEISPWSNRARLRLMTLSISSSAVCATSVSALASTTPK